MKKVFSIILITILMFVLCACGSIDNKNNTLADNTPQDIQEEVKQQNEQQTGPINEELAINQDVPCADPPVGDIIEDSTQLYQIPDPVITWKGNRDELTGLTLQSPPEEVELLYSKALRTISRCEFYSWSYEEGYSLDTNDSITINNQTYYAIKCGGENLTSLKDYFCNVFTAKPAEEFANRYFNKEFYTEKNGKVYFYDFGGGRGSNISLLWDKVAGFAKIDETHALMQVETAFGEMWIDNEYITAKDVVEEYVEDIYHLVLEDGVWKFDDVISYYR